jgi:hypothetical protein
MARVFALVSVLALVGCSDGGGGVDAGGAGGGASTSGGIGGMSSASGSSMAASPMHGGASPNGGASGSGMIASGGTDDSGAGSGNIAGTGIGGAPGGGGGAGGAVNLGGAATGGSAGNGSGGSAQGLLTNRAASIPVGIENVNDSPLKSASYRALLRFVPDTDIEIDRFYFGFKLRGAECWNENAGYGAGDGGTLTASLVNIDAATGLPTTEIDSESVNGCTRHNEAKATLGGDPVMVWVNLQAKLQGGQLYAVIIGNSHAQPATNFFSFNAPLADTALAGPHAKNELNQAASGGILGLDPREHVAWSTDAGKTWKYGSDNGQYKSYMNDHDTAHPATRMPQYGFRIAGGANLAVQPYYAYSTDCTGCGVTYANARYARSLTMAGGFTASGDDVGTLTVTNTTTGAKSSCTPTKGYGFRTCTLPQAIGVAVGQSFTVSGTGTVEVMEMDNPQRLLFPKVGTIAGEIRTFTPNPSGSVNAKDVPNLWAGPLSTNFKTAGDP